MTTVRATGIQRGGVALLLTSGLFLLASAGWAAPDKSESNAVPARQEFAEGGLETCLRCHDSAAVQPIFATPHMKGTDPDSPAARKQCESCHGPSARHVQFPLHAGNIRFTRHDDSTTKAARNRVCLECHLEGEQASWRKSPHGSDGIACVDCHTVHAVADPILSEETQTQRCAEGCHGQILASQPAGTPHPLEGEEAILCTACHTPHEPLDLASCHGCHPWQPKDLAAQSGKARSYHQRAVTKEIACTECHQGFVHPLPEPIGRRPPTSDVHLGVR